MTVARQVLPGKTVLITRRCSERRHFLHGGGVEKELCEYLLALGCAKFGVRLVGAVVMSNHLHLVVHDPDGRHPDFTEWFDSLIARALNCHRGRTGHFWDARPVNVVELVDGETVLDEVAYVMANPTASGLVKHGHEWVGVRSGLADYVRPRVVKRPKMRFFGRRTRMPREATLCYAVPPMLEHMSAAEFGAEVEARAAAREAQARLDAKAKGREFVGPDGLRGTGWTRRARTPEETGIRPLVAAATAEGRRAVLDRVATFRVEYSKALALFRAGQRDVLFPHGSFHMVACLGANCDLPTHCGAQPG